MVEKDFFGNNTKSEERDPALKQCAQELKALNAVSRRINSSVTLDQITSAALEEINNSIAPDLILLLLMQNRELNVQGIQSSDPDLQYPGSTIIHAGECLCGLAASEGKPQYCNDIHTDPRCSSTECKKMGMQSFAAFPLIKGIEIIGVLGIASKIAKDFSQRAIFLETVANIISTALQSILSHQEDEQRAEVLQQQVFERLKADLARYEIEARQAAILRTMPLILYCAKTPSPFSATWMTDNVKQVTGFPVEPFLNESGFWAKRVHPDDQERVEHAFEMIRSKKVMDLEYRWQCADDRYRWFFDHMVSIQSQSDETLEYFGTWLDITERKQAEEALEISEVRYRRLFETAKDGILIMDADTGQICDANPSLEEMLGYSRHDLLGKALWEIGLFKDLASSQDAFKELQVQKHVRWDNLPLLTKSGQHKHVEIISNVYMVEDWKVIQCDIRDITERKRAEEALQKSEERYRRLAEMAPKTEELSALVNELRKREHETKQINHLNDLLQTCRTLDEACKVIALSAGDIFIGQSGSLALMHPSGKYLDTVAKWGEEILSEPVFSVEDCWAMRRGLPHQVNDITTSMVCRHLIQIPKAGYLCLPLIVHGETIGLLHISAPEGNDFGQDSSQFQLTLSVSEIITLSLSNLKLREILHEQATYDSLTGLFNRRYLEDTMPRELHRALRQNTPMCIAMLDIDNFKLFNDKYGREAGDMLLHELGQLFLRNLRKSDIACRYGGEEFVLIMPDLSLEDAMRRLEQIRQKVNDLQIHISEQISGKITISGGAAIAPDHGMTVDDLLHSSDSAMHAAKQAGRNCIVSFQSG